MNKMFWIAVAIVAVIGGAVLLLVTGGSPSGSGRDASGDVVVRSEGAQPADTTLADLVASEVTVTGGEATFEATLGTELPEKIDDGSLELRWDVQGGGGAWIIQVNLNVALSAAVTSQQTRYGSSTIDDTLPGEVEMEGDTVTLTIEIDQIKNFPTDFQWRLTSTLDGALTDMESAVATDSLPDSGTNQVRSE